MRAVSWMTMLSLDNPPTSAYAIGRGTGVVRPMPKAMNQTGTYGKSKKSAAYARECVRNAA
ncbi:MAG: hypothetical protein IPN58_06620 [Anaerolineales bacterium]|nr:hypothetical protein [Anaerolineales bacterium]